MTTSTIEAAKSNRSKCKICKNKIKNGELRFGVYNERWESYTWHHLVCGASIDPKDFVEAVEDFGGDVGDVDAILQEAKNVGKGTKTPRVELAKTGRSKCVVCKEQIEKDSLRGVLYYEVDIDEWRKGNTHLGCMQSVSDLDRDDLLDQIKENSILDDDQFETVVEEL